MVTATYKIYTANYLSSETLTRVGSGIFFSEILVFVFHDCNTNGLSSN